MKLAQDIRESSKWLIGSNVFSQVLQFAIGIALARLLVPADFGMLVTIQIFTGVLGMLASGGMGQALVRAKDASELDFQVIFTLQFLLCLTIFAVLYLIAPAFSIWFSEPLYKELLRVSAWGFILRPFMGIHTNWLTREMRFKDLSIQTFLAGAISGIASIGMAANGLGVWSLVVGGLIGSVSNYLMIAHLTPIRVRFRLDREITRTHSSYGIKLVVKDFVVYFRKQSSNLIIAKLGDASMVGLFNKGSSLAELPFTAISGPIFQPVFRTMAAEQDNPEKIKYLFYKMITLLMLYTAPLYIGLSWLAEPFIVAVFGEHWRESAIVLQLLAPLGLLYCIGHPAGAVLAATNRLGREAVVHTITWIIVASGCVIGLHWGLVGISIAIIISQIYSTLHIYLIAQKAFSNRVRDLLYAIAPPLTFNSALVLTLSILELLLPAEIKSNAPKTFLALMSSAGAAAYLLCFFYLPFPATQAEAERIRRFFARRRATSSQS
ncbi:MAG: lipopolysaccharide biosynthesis protein [Nitrospira sp.]|uniref:lipopolysaccharide biosynthesis protein n=1 Tax=Thauera sp. 2A1 TaxID=2570191 RepID=UPI0012920BA3|nr:lipopolysaccharide biosynthesis protein [Thauera sp. 2A1]KAI5916688.1 lipopolysaccharide biosynthesis protein [Thauera sp. 2A1]MBS0176012.1 lipopolysaccharide biosynthesis protein [Nitrospira sp.]